MSVNFPSNPAANDQHTEEGMTWVYNDPPGAWVVLNEPSEPEPSPGDGAYELVEIYEPTTNAQIIEFNTVFSDYYKIKIEMYLMSNSQTQNALAEIGNDNGEWYDMLEQYSIGYTKGTVIFTELMNCDDTDGTGFVGINSGVSTTAVFTRNTGSFDGEGSANVNMRGFYTHPEPITNFRIRTVNTSGFAGTDSNKRCIIKIYGAQAIEGQPVSPLAPLTEFGPYATIEDKTPYWLRAVVIESKPLPATWQVGFNATKPFDPDVWMPVDQFLADDIISDSAKDDVEDQIGALS